jgi:hypothetical protein
MLPRLFTHAAGPSSSYAGAEQPARYPHRSRPDFFGFMLNALSQNADRALKLLRDMIEEPA